VSAGQLMEFLNTLDHFQQFSNKYIPIKYFYRVLREILLLFEGSWDKILGQPNNYWKSERF
jgi:hypothetical protein